MLEAKKTEDIQGQIIGYSTLEMDDSVAEQVSVDKMLQTEESPAPEIIHTLPHSFNSMIGESIDVKTDDAHELIRLLGKKLGIEDYRTNMAAFWLLDTIALEVIQNKKKLSPVNLGIMVSWISGEAKLIQDNKCSRAQFFQEMNFIFEKVSGLFDQGQTMMYWEEVTRVYDPFQTKEQIELKGEFAFEPASESLRLADPDELKSEDNLGKAGMMFDSVELNSSSHSSTLTKERHQSDRPISDSSTHVLQAIVESTYSVYANAFHYATISAAFAHPVEIHSYQLPYTLRFPRPIKPPVTVVTQIEGAHGKARTKTEKGNLGKNKGKEKSKSKSLGEIQPPPLPMTAEDIMDQKRRHILPLMESNEAVHLLDQLTQLQGVGSTGTSVDKKMTKKGKRK